MFVVYFFVFKQKTAYELRISDWSSDVCSSDLSAMRMAGTDARIRVSSVIAPSFNGTFKSERMKTRLPASAPESANEERVLMVDICVRLLGYETDKTRAGCPALV